MAVRPTRGGGRAVAQAFLGLAAEPLNTVQQRESRERSGIAGRRTVEEEKHEKGDAGQQGEPGERHIPSRVASGEAARSFCAQAESLLRVLMMHGRDASPIGDGGQRSPQKNNRCRAERLVNRTGYAGHVGLFTDANLGGGKARLLVLESSGSIASAALG